MAILLSQAHFEKILIEWSHRDRMHDPLSNAEDIRHLEMMTYRKYRYAKHIAENAARGIFPSTAKPQHMVDFSPEEFNKIIAAKIRWKKAAILKLQADSPP